MCRTPGLTHLWSLSPHTSSSRHVQPMPCTHPAPSATALPLTASQACRRQWMGTANEHTEPISLGLENPCQQPNWRNTERNQVRMSSSLCNYMTICIVSIVTCMSRVQRRSTMFALTAERHMSWQHQCLLKEGSRHITHSCFKRCLSRYQQQKQALYSHSMVVHAWH